MDCFNGIEIAEYKLLTHSIFFSVFFIIGIVLTIVVIVITNGNYFKSNSRNVYYELEKRAQTDDLAKKRLEKLKRKAKKKRKQKIADIIFECFLLILCMGIAIVSLLVGVIPGWTDYIKKDYVVYTGEIAVYDNYKHGYITIEDGTKIEGTSIFDSNDKSGTLVYSKRMRIALGGVSDN